MNAPPEARSGLQHLFSSVAPRVTARGPGHRVSVAGLFDRHIGCSRRSKGSGSHNLLWHAGTSLPLAGWIGSQQAVFGRGTVEPANVDCISSTGVSTKANLLRFRLRILTASATRSSAASHCVGGDPDGDCRNTVKPTGVSLVGWRYFPARGF